jgi:hypothetical protein
MGHSLNRTSFRINQNLVIDDKTFNPGHILVSDIYGNVSWQNPSQYISSDEPLDRFIGELYGGGIVTAVWREQRDTLYEICLIASVRNYNEPPLGGVSMNDSNYNWAWSATNNIAIGTASRSHTFGASNSFSIISQNNTNGYAAINCYNYTNEDLYGLGIYSDWYLPSTYEINCLANNAAIVDRVISQYATDKAIPIDIAPFLPPKMSIFQNISQFDTVGLINGYWTSTEYNAGSAHYLNLGVGGVRFATASKSSSMLVRPFRQDVKRWNGETWISLEEGNRRRTGKILITHNDTIVEDLGPSIVLNITNIETSLLNTVTYEVYSNILSTDLSIYDHIWDIGVELQTNSLSGLIQITQNSKNVTGTSTFFLTNLVPGDAITVNGSESYVVATVTSNTLFTITTNAVVTRLNASVIVDKNDKLTRTMGTKYTTYLQNGGGLFILGENNYFNVRNKDISKFITGLGGGTVTTSTSQTSDTLTVQSEFLLANTTNTVTFNASGYFSSIGNGTSITTLLGAPIPAAVVWKTGSLSLAPKGAIVSVLDINWLSSQWSDAYRNSSKFASNVSQILNKK